METAGALTARLAQQATIGIALTKRALDAAETNTLDAQLDVERDLQDEAGHTPITPKGCAPLSRNARRTSPEGADYTAS